MTVAFCEVRALRSAEINAVFPSDPRYNTATCTAPLRDAGCWGTKQEPSRIGSDGVTRPHEVLPWGFYYRNLVSQARTWNMRE